MDRQQTQIQQHHEKADFKQQHGGTYLAAGHHLQKLQDCRFPLDHNAQPAAPHLERWQDTLHTEVNILPFDSCQTSNSFKEKKNAVKCKPYTKFSSANIILLTVNITAAATTKSLHTTDKNE